MPKFEWINIRAHHSLCLLTSILNLFPCEFYFLSTVVVLSTANLPIYISKNITSNYPYRLLLFDSYGLLPFYTFNLINYVQLCGISKIYFTILSSLLHLFALRTCRCFVTRYHDFPNHDYYIIAILTRVEYWMDIVCLWTAMFNYWPEVHHLGKFKSFLPSLVLPY